MTERRHAYALRDFLDLLDAKVELGEMTVSTAADQARMHGVPIKVAVRVLARRK